ncbi:hypothetical protein HAX54_043921 [Datura stramonium]|uniref:Uncharacterized protein n=1 Tax=Datura stramonium TaxID=4076 RepID=A0ABS8W5C5_DATST|nr:hypothetical protein [Datura stramonium]
MLTGLIIAPSQFAVIESPVNNPNEKIISSKLITSNKGIDQEADPKFSNGSTNYIKSSPTSHGRLMQVDRSFNHQYYRLPTLIMTTSPIFGAYGGPIIHMHHQSLHKNSGARAKIAAWKTHSFLEVVPTGLRKQWETCSIEPPLRDFHPQYSLWAKALRGAEVNRLDRTSTRQELLALHKRAPGHATPGRLRQLRKTSRSPSFSGIEVKPNQVPSPYLVDKELVFTSGCA